jgi:4-hydroxy-3-polyprenylbenzoate decarboxylase/2,5-furandicarboxylate decarboxylase 1
LPYQDFREFLDALRKACELIEVDRAVSPELEVAKALRKSAAMSGPAVIFKNKGTAFPVVGGVYNTRSKALIAFQTTEKDAFERVLHRMATRIPRVAVADGPVHENVITGDAVDISVVPVCKYSPDDGGPYITAGIVVSKDPEAGVPDIGHYRLEVIDKQTKPIARITRRSRIATAHFSRRCLPGCSRPRTISSNRWPTRRRTSPC